MLSHSYNTRFSLSETFISLVVFCENRLPILGAFWKTSSVGTPHWTGERSLGQVLCFREGLMLLMMRQPFVGILAQGCSVKVPILNLYLDHGTLHRVKQLHSQFVEF